MARKGRVDRGLLQKHDAEGKKIWYVRLHHEGKERRFGSFSTKTAARDFYNKAKLDQKTGRFFPERYQHGGFEVVQEVFARYWSSIGILKPTTRRRYRTISTWWEERFMGQRVNAITAAAVEDARHFLLKTGRAASTVNRYVAWLRHVMNMAMREGKLAINPASKLTMFKESQGKTRFLSLDEEGVLLKALSSDDAKAARLAIVTGMRQMEQFSLRWADVDLELGIITLSTTKAGGVQYVTLNDEAKAILRSLDSWERSAWVYPSVRPWRVKCGVGHRDPAGILRRFRSAVQSANIAHTTWHDLRHTFASRLAMNGQREGTIAALLRHSTTSLVKRYAHLSPAYLKEAVEGISTFGRVLSLNSLVSQEQQEASSRPMPNGTVTETGKAEVEPMSLDAISH